MSVTPLSPESYQLADALASFPVMSSAYVLFAPPQGQSSAPAGLNSATVTLVTLNGRQMGLTAQHVIDRYRQRTANGEQLIFYIGNVVLDLDTCLLSESAFLDIAVLDLTRVDPSAVRGTSEIPCTFHTSRSWPGEQVTPGDFVLLAGWPADTRTALAPGRLQFASFSSGGAEVQSVQSDVITCRLEIDECHVVLDRTGRGAPDFPGISGGPMFRSAVLDGGVTVFDLVGIIFEYHKELDVLRARPVSLIGEDGKIVC